MNSFDFQLDNFEQEKNELKELIDIKIVKRLSYIPNGEYNGIQSGYDVTFVADGNEYVATSPIGVRGINEPVKIIVNNRGVFVK